MSTDRKTEKPNDGLDKQIRELKKDNKILSLQIKHTVLKAKLAEAQAALAARQAELSKTKD